jgi:hypothetical protein
LRIRGKRADRAPATWVGLEDAAASFALGFSCDDLGHFGLGVLTVDEYEKRRSRILTGRPPTE